MESAKPHSRVPGLLQRVTGRWQRHNPGTHGATALSGRVGYGRWASPEGFPVLYLGRPLESVVAEAFRHLADPVGDPNIVGAIAPRILVTCKLDVNSVLDLTRSENRSNVKITVQDMLSSTNDHRAYQRCRTVASAAYEQGHHGILAPAATGLGLTLVLFTEKLTDAERPARVLPDQIWRKLPPDPRRVGFMDSSELKT